MMKFLIEGLYKQLMKIYVFIKPYVTYIMNRLDPNVTVNFFEIPIIINNKNKLSDLKGLIEYFNKCGYNNIYIIDNASTYPPLLNYYENECKCFVFRLTRNMGHLALWESGIINQFKNNYFAYTDPDILPLENCPTNFIEVFWGILSRYPLVEKVGFSLKIDDLPDCFSKKEKVIEWEQQFWKYKIEENPPLYKAAIDTTFALYRPHYFVGGNLKSPHIRVGGSFQVRHLPWYSDSSNISEEDLYYTSHSETFTHWTTGKLK